MAKPEELAQIICGGRVYDAWTSVEVSRAFDEPLSSFRFTCVEPVDKNAKGLSLLQLKPSDRVSIVLAGHKVIEGFITDRQVGLDSQNHSVLIVGYSRFVDAMVSNIPVERGEYKNYSFEQIARSVLQPFGIKFSMANAGADAAKRFAKTSPWPDETVWEYLERLSRMRGIFMHSDENGDVVAGRLQPVGAAAQLEEGGNILAASCTISDSSARDYFRLTGQEPAGGDDVSDNRARQLTAEVSSTYGRARFSLTYAESPGDADDMRIRADRESDKLASDFVSANVVVQGWLKPSGGLWQFQDSVTVNAPSLALFNRTLAVRRVTWSQNESGTRTMMELVRPQYLGGTAAGVKSGLYDPAGSEPQPAKTAAEAP